MIKQIEFVKKHNEKFALVVQQQAHNIETKREIITKNRIKFIRSINAFFHHLIQVKNPKT